VSDRQYNISEQIKGYLKADENFKITVNTLPSVASKAYDLFLSANIEQKRKLINYLFSNLELKGVALQYSLKKPFDLMVNCSTYQEWLGVLNTLRTPRDYNLLAQNPTLLMDTTSDSYI
jgi:hypothetical protein